VGGAGPLLLAYGACRELLGSWLGIMVVQAEKFGCGSATPSTTGKWLDGEATWKGETFDGVWIPEP
jgi:hypothetical protein